MAGYINITKAIKTNDFNKPPNCVLPNNGIITSLINITEIKPTINLVTFVSRVPSHENLINLLSIGQHINVAMANPEHSKVSTANLTGSTSNLPALSYQWGMILLMHILLLKLKLICRHRK